MELPNYFLADLPDQSALTPRLITEACQSLRQNRRKFLAAHSTESLIQILAKLAREWLDPNFSFRKLVLENGPDQTGFPRETLARGMDRFFAQLTPENLQALILQDLGALTRLDEIAAGESERKQDRASIARGPELLVHITGGLLPNPAFTSILLGLLARSAQFVKCPAGGAYLPRMFAHSLYSVQPKLGACLEIAEWPGGTAPLENALFAEADCLTATGADETLTRIRQRLPARVRFLGYGHQLSLAYVARESLERMPKIISALVDDIVAWNQLGCLSPHAIYVESGGAQTPETFSEQLARELEAREKIEPRGPIPPEVAAAISTRRMFYQVRASADPATKIWTSADSTAWTVVHDNSNSTEFQPSCLHRFIHVRSVQDLEPLLATLEPLRGQISTVALAAPLVRARQIALRFAQSAGATRICRAGEMQNPPLTWRHDGRPSLADLVTWTDIELK